MSPTGSDAAAGGIGTPWATLGHASDTMAAGDSLFIRGGVYDADPNNVPTQIFDVGGKSSLTISNYPGETPIFKNQKRVGAPVALFNGGDCMAIKIFGLTSTNHDCFIYWYRATNCELGWNNIGPGVVSYLNHPPAYAVALYNHSPSNWIHHNFFHDSEASWADGAQHDSGGVLQIGADPDTPSDHSCFNRIENNTNYHGGHDVINIQAGYNIIRSNYFYNDAFYSVPAVPTYAGHRCISIEGPCTIVEHNRAAYSSFPYFNDGAECITVETATNLIRFNEVIWAYNTGIDLYQKSAYTVSQNHVYHNTVAWNGLSPQTVGGIEQDKYVIRIVGYATSVSNYFVNNLLAFNNYWAGGANFSNRIEWFDNNFWLNNWSNNPSSDPLFTTVPSSPTTLLDGVSVLGRPSHPEDIDLHLQASSPCINIGSFLTTITSANGSGTTFNVADTRYFWAGYGIVQGDTIQLEGQSATAVITACDWGGSSITVNQSLTWTSGQGVALAYSGSAPDMGANEYQTGGSTPTRAVNAVTVHVGTMTQPAP